MIEAACVDLQYPISPSKILTLISDALLNIISSEVVDIKIKLKPNTDKIFIQIRVFADDFH